MSRFQARLLLSRAHHARVGVLLDSDAYAASILIKRMFSEHGIFPDQRLRGGAFVVRLKEGDPGDYSREWLKVLIDNADAASRAVQDKEQ